SASRRGAARSAAVRRATRGSQASLQGGVVTMDSGRTQYHEPSGSGPAEEAAATAFAAGARPRRGGGGVDRRRPSPGQVRPPLRAAGIGVAPGAAGPALRPGGG